MPSAPAVRSRRRGWWLVSSSRRRKSDPTARAWTPLELGTVNPQLVQACINAGANPPIAVFHNDTYQVSVYGVGDPPEMLHLSIKRHDRHVIRDWRHLQAIKNEVAGPDCYAVEIFPPEDRLVDSANEFHLWVFPEGFELPFGLDEYLVSSDVQIADFNRRREAGEHKGRQRPFQDGLPVALGRNEQPGADVSLMSGLWARVGMRQRVPDNSQLKSEVDEKSAGGVKSP